MTTLLTYGKATTCVLDSDEVTYLRPQQDSALPIDEIALQLRSQLAEPLNFPALSQATIPGDRVAVVVQQGMPCLLQVLDGALVALRDAGVESELVTILLPHSSSNADHIQAELAALGHEDCSIKVHNPEDEKATSFLGVTRAGVGLRLNRELCDADLVLSLAVTQCESNSRESTSGFEGLFPDFSDSETIHRFSALSAEEATEDVDSSLAEIKECGWLLGIGLVVQVVPGPGGQVARVFAGEPATVAKEALAEYRRIWSTETQLRGDLVIATLTGGSSEQTWQNVSRAIVAAESVLEDGGTIAICSELDEPLGRSLSHLASNEDPLVIQREILSDPSADSGPALRLSRALDRGTIYLRSRLHSPMVESLGISPLESDNELERLAQAHRPCIVLEEAQRSLPFVTETE